LILGLLAAGRRFGPLARAYGRVGLRVGGRHPRRECLVERDRLGLGIEAAAPSLPAVPPPDDELASLGIEPHAHHGPPTVGVTCGPLLESMCQRPLPRKLTHPGATRHRTTKHKSPATRGLRVMRRRGLEPPPGYPGPGPQPGNPGVISVRCVPDRPYRPGARTIRTHRTIWMLPRRLPPNRPRRPARAGSDPASATQGPGSGRRRPPQAPCARPPAVSLISADGTSSHGSNAGSPTRRRACR